MSSFWSFFPSKRIFPLATLLAFAIFSSSLTEGAVVGNKSAEPNVNATNRIKNYQSALRGLRSATEYELVQSKDEGETTMHTASGPARVLGRKKRIPIIQQTNSSSIALAQKSQQSKLKATLSTLPNTFSATDPVTITLTIENWGEKPATILKWFIPSSSIDADVLQGNAFSVKYASGPVTLEQLAIQSNSQTNGNGRVAPGTYIGVNIKRARPTYEDYQVLSPGEIYTVTLDLADYYSFSKEGVYRVVYDVINDQLFSEAGSNGGVARLTSNALQLNIAGRFKPSYTVNLAVNALTGTAANTFISCEPWQQSSIITARQDALTCSTYLNDVYMSSFNPNNTNARYTEWFGLDTLSANVDTINKHVANIKDVFLSADMVFDCTCTDTSKYAYVDKIDPYKIYLCGAFWYANEQGIDSKMGTLVHETSHFVIVANTDDYAYGQWNCRNLALSDPSQAVTNADSHEYFCESSILAETQAPSKPVVAPIAKPVVAPFTKPFISPVAKPVVALVTKPVVAPVAKPVVAPVAKPVVAPVTKPVVAPVAKPLVSPVAKPVVAPVTKPVVAPVAKPVVAPVTKPVLAPVTKPGVAPVTKPGVAPVTKPIL